MYNRSHVMTTQRAVLLLAAIGLTTSLPPPNEAQSKPHVILIVADDLGWNDVSWHNPKAMTPHLEDLAKSGVLLEQSYVQPICTPTRSALMTGRYPYTVGRQHDVLWPEEPTGLSIKRQLLPQAMKAAGYSTHAVGKWHLGFCSWDYTPTSRGFDTFWGYYTGAEDYYHHTRPRCSSEDQPTDNIYSQDLCDFDSTDNSENFGYDFRNNTAVEYSVDGEYSTYAFSSYIENLLETRNQSDPMFLYLPFQSVHSPLQVPENYTKPFAYIKHRDRRTKLGMVLAMDEAVGRIVTALKNSGHYNNTVIVFTTDNGGPTVSAGNNWPLRGNKTTLWEGGTRGVAFVHSPLLPSKGVVSNKLIHVTDWFATIVGLGGGDAPEDTDGYDQWEAITTSAPSPRTEMIYNIDVTEQMNAGIRLGVYKLLIGNPGPGEWTPPPEGDQNTYQDSNMLHEFVESPFYTPELKLSESGQIKSEYGQESQLPRVRRSVRSEDFNGGPFIVKADVNSGSLDMETPKENLSENIQGNVTSVEKNDDLLKLSNLEHEYNLFSESMADPKIQTDFEYENDLVTARDLGLQTSNYMILELLMGNDTQIQLYNIIDDPDERINLALKEVNVVKILLGLLHYCMNDYVKPDILPNDPAANPVHWNNTWSPGWCHAK